MVKNAKRQVRGKRAKQTEGRVAIGDVPVEQMAMNCNSGLAPDEELAQLDALDDADRRDDERADLPDPATDIY